MLNQLSTWWNNSEITEISFFFLNVYTPAQQRPARRWAEPSQGEVPSITHPPGASFGLREGWLDRSAPWGGEILNDSLGDARSDWILIFKRPDLCTNAYCSRVKRPSSKSLKPLSLPSLYLSLSEVSARKATAGAEWLFWQPLADISFGLIWF